MIKALFLRNFRNYKEASLSFGPKINAIWGENAQGKTNLLEAIYLLIAGRSFRTIHLNELIRFGEKSFYLEALFEKNGIEQRLQFLFDGKKRKIIHNATILPSLSSLLGILNGVILSPEDRSLVKGGPLARRHFLDLLIAQSNPLYLHHLTRYTKAMKQRNALLKARSLKTIEVWEEQMAPSAAFLTLRRLNTIKELEKVCISETLASDKLNLEYKSSALNKTPFEHSPLITYFLEQFNKQRPREIELGMTLTGPHRDDLLIKLHEKEAHKFASTGQQHSCVSSLKLSQWKWLDALLGEKPLMCIDDIAVSFDAAREQELYTRVHTLGQVFTTSPQEPSIDCRSIGIESGHFIS
ncbi:MAG: DNA replication and repair protein RecF [Chlamydiales bacterium]|nr:DNA replication and repair protein RecF [Chlamydiales bacterium]